MNRRMLALAAIPAVLLALAGCDRTDAPAPTVGQTTQMPGNEDTCVWTGDRWAEADDGQDCTWELDGHGGSHATKRRTATVGAPTSTTRRTSSTTRRATSRSARPSAPRRTR